MQVWPGGDTAREWMVVSVTKTEAPASHHAGRCPADAELVRRAANGDEDAMERLLMRAQEVACRFSLLVCGHPEDAEDVTCRTRC